MVKLNVTTHSGNDDIVMVDDYNAEEMASKVNNIDLQAIAIGNNVYSRIDLKNIKLVEGSETLLE